MSEPYSVCHSWCSYLWNKPNATSNESRYDVVQTVRDHPGAVVLDHASSATDAVDYDAANAQAQLVRYHQ